MRAGRIFSTFLFTFSVAALSIAGSARAADSDATDAAALKEIRAEMRQMREERRRDRQVIRSLEIKVQQLQTRDTKVETTTQQLQNTDQKLKETTLELEQTNAQVKTLQTKVDAPIASSQFGDAVQQYLGSHSFTVTGAAGGNFIYDQQSGALDDLHHASQNSFFFDWEPMILYRPNDWMLFEGVISTNFGSTGTGVDLSIADFQIFLNKYMEVVAGLFDQPFGDWYEAQSPMWVNRFVTAPLPFGVEPVVPPAELESNFGAVCKSASLVRMPTIRSGSEMDLISARRFLGQWSPVRLLSRTARPTVSRSGGAFVYIRCRLIPRWAASSLAHRPTMASG